MSENGTRNRGSIWRDVTEQISDHLDLAALELRFETRQAKKRLLAAAACIRPDIDRFYRSSSGPCGGAHAGGAVSGVWHPFF